MKRIDIHTYQNVAINYELTSLGNRILAYILDLLAVTIFLFLDYQFFSLIGEEDEMVVFFLFYLPVVLFYGLVSEIIFNGQTLGKKLLKIRVVSINGESTSIFSFVTRWAFKAIDIGITLGTMAIALILSSQKNQRLGDMIADTIVINIKDNQDLKLEEILKIEDESQHQIKYPSVNLLNEKQVIIIKKTIIRHREYHNKAHKEAINELAKKLKSILEINIEIEDEEQFLKDLLKDYIVSTR